MVLSKIGNILKILLFLKKGLLFINWLRVFIIGETTSDYFENCCVRTIVYVPTIEDNNYLLPLV